MSAPDLGRYLDPLEAATAARRAIVRSCIVVLRRTAFHEATLEMVAAEANVPADLVVAQFGSWNGLVLAAVDRWTMQRMAPFRETAENHGTVAFLRGIVMANVEDPALVRLLTSLLGVAAMPDHPMAPLLRQDWNRFYGTVQLSLLRDVELGREPSTMDPARGAEQLIALYEGLQMQFMVRPRMNLLESFDRGVTRLRQGWNSAYVAPVWDLSA
jgi:AcrR family transcriptional regulator